MWIITFAILAVTIYLWLEWRKKKFSVLREMGIPGPEPSIFFGNLLDMGKKNALQCQKEWIEKYGKICGYYFGVTPMVLIADTELLKIIQVSEFHKFMNRPGIFVGRKKKSQPGDGLSSQITCLRDKRWKEVRSILTPSFTTRKMRMMAHSINEAIDTFLEIVDGKSKKREIFDIYELFQSFSMDVIGRAAFGVQTNCQKNKDDPFLRASKVIFSGTMANIFTLFNLSFPEMKIWAYIDTVRLMLQNRGKNPVMELIESVQKVIKMRREEKSQRRNDLLQLMIDARVSESDFHGVTGEGLTAGSDHVETVERQESSDGNIPNSGKLYMHKSDNEIIDNAVLFFLVGYETTSTSLAFTTHFLLHYPDVQEKVRKEVNDLVKQEGKLDYYSVQKLPYLEQVFMESLRMYPPVHFFVSREVSEDVEIGKLRLKKGFCVQVPVHMMQHDPDLWPDPEIFDPDRFSPENKAKHNSLAFQAFGAGPRNCVGMRFAQMETKLVIARLLQKYRLCTCEETDKLDLNLRVSPATTSPARGVKIQVVPI